MERKGKENGGRERREGGRGRREGRRERGEERKGDKREVWTRKPEPEGSWRQPVPVISLLPRAAQMDTDAVFRHNTH